MNSPPQHCYEMDQFTVCDCDDYVAHLLRLSVEQQLVVAAENVSNQFGVVLLRQGTPLSTLAAQKMRGQRLLRPVDELLKLRHGLDAESLLACFDELVEGEADLRGVHREQGFNVRLAHLCMTLKLPDSLWQKLGVMRASLPRCFQRALFCAWLGTLIAAARDFDAGETALVFSAALLHDIGLLHIEPQLVDKRQDISDAEWLQIRNHPEIGARIVESLHASPGRLPSIIRQHHERRDGSGYPAGLSQQALDRLSCIIALCDLLHAIRFQNLVINNCSLADCMPFLRVNRHSFDVDNYAATARIIVNARGPEKGQFSGATSASLVSTLLLANRSLIRILTFLREHRAQIAELEHDPAGCSVVRLLDQADSVAQAAGMGNESLGSLFEQSIAQSESASALEEMCSTAKELFWLIRRVERQLCALLPRMQSREGAAVAHELGVLCASELRRAWKLLSRNEESSLTG